MGFVEKRDELIDWEGRTKSEGPFSIDVLHAHGKQSILDVATGTGFHSVRLTQAGFDVIRVDGSAAMLAKAFQNGQKRGLILKTVRADWRRLNRSIHGKYDAHLPWQLVHPLAPRTRSSTPRLFISEASSAIREIRAGRWACGGCGLPRPHTSVPKEESPVKNAH